MKLLSGQVLCEAVFGFSRLLQQSGAQNLDSVSVIYYSSNATWQKQTLVFEQ